MAMANRGESGVGGGGLGSPLSRAKLAVSQNKKSLAQQARETKNNAIKKAVTKTANKGKKK